MPRAATIDAQRLFNLYANGVSVFAEAALFRTRAHAVGVAAKHLDPGRATNNQAKPSRLADSGPS